MKVLFFIDSLTAGGKERRLTELMKELRRNNNIIDFTLVIMKNEIHYEEVLHLNIPIHYLIRKTKKDLSVFKSFFKICEEFDPDIVHCWDSMTAIYAIPTCQIKSIKLINGMVVNTPVQRNILNKYWLRAQITFPFSTVIVGNSKAGLEAYKAPKRKSLCIYNGMDLNRFNNLKDAALVTKEIFKTNIPPEAFIIGMVAAFEDRKDYNTLIRAAKQLISSNDNIYFILVGDGMNLNEIRKSVPERLLDKIVFLGKRSDVESIVNIFDVGILLTNRKVHGEGVSNSIIEYMALGKPVIATRGGGTNEVICDKVNGYLIDPESDMQLIERIQTLMNDKCLRENLGRRARKLARENFDLQIMTNNYIRLYYHLRENKNNIK